MSIKLLEYQQSKNRGGRPKRDVSANVPDIPPKFKNLLPWQYKVLVARFNSPKTQQIKLCKELGVNPASISTFLKTDKYKNAVVEYGKDTFFSLIPLAVIGVRESLLSTSADVKYKASVKLLEDCGVLSKEAVTRIMNQINTQINVSALELKGKSIPELNEMLLTQLRFK